MKYYLAPLEGITGRIYRNTFHEYFDNNNVISKYFTPFIVYHEKCSLSSKDIKDIHPDNNKGINIIPQLLINKASEYIPMEKTLMEYGYDEININIGCPSKTVFSKKRGAGLLLYPDMLDEMLYGIFANNNVRVSVKTRIGVEDPEEFFAILDIYNRYNIEELIIHPRVQSQYYNGQVNMAIYEYAMKNAKMNLCYNGNLFSVEDIHNISDKADVVMLGRGVISRPSIIREANGGSIFDNRELKEFLTSLRIQYTQEFSGDVPVLFKMKELWSYLKQEFPENQKELKKIFKTRNIAEYIAYENQILK